MYQFFIEDENAAEDFVTIEAAMSTILKMCSDETGRENPRVHRSEQNYFCSISDITESFVRADILEKEAESTELPCRIYLFQGLRRMTRWNGSFRKLWNLEFMRSFRLP